MTKSRNRRQLAMFVAALYGFYLLIVILCPNGWNAAHACCAHKRPVCPMGKCVTDATSASQHELSKPSPDSLPPPESVALVLGSVLVRPEPTAAAVLRLPATSLPEVLRL